MRIIRLYCCEMSEEICFNKPHFLPYNMCTCKNNNKTPDELTKINYHYVAFDWLRNNIFCIRHIIHWGNDDSKNWTCKRNDTESVTSFTRTHFLCLPSVHSEEQFWHYAQNKLYISSHGLIKKVHKICYTTMSTKRQVRRFI